MRRSLQVQSLLRADGTLELSLAAVDVPDPAPDEVVVRVEATPINPSDIGLMFGAADLASLRTSGTPGRPAVAARVPEARMNAMAGRVGTPMPVGNEGSGTVVAAGSSPEARALLGKTVAAFGGAMYAQFRGVKVAQCLPLPPGTTAAEGASCFVNPLTALGFVETMRREGHSAIVHTAAASNLGQMLNRICLADAVPLVNVVRSAEQAALLRSQGAAHVVDSSAPSFVADLTDAIAATGATIAFDAVGGGTLGGTILGCMEAVLVRRMGEYSRYGSPVHKQIYIYGMLDTAPTVLPRNAGFAWSVGGWLLWPFLRTIGPAGAAKLRERIAAGLKTTFASRYGKVISLAQALDPAEIAVYAKRATGEKFLIDPSRDAAP